MIPARDALTANADRGAPELDLGPHLWAGETLVWCERPSPVGAFLATLRHSFVQANEAVGLLSGPVDVMHVVLVLFPSLLFALLVIVAPLLVVAGALALALALSLAVAAGVTPWLRRRASRVIWYAITTRRVLVLRGTELMWDVHGHWVRARVPWHAGDVGTVVFARDRNDELEVRFTGVRHPRTVVDIANRAAAAERSS